MTDMLELNPGTVYRGSQSWELFPSELRILGFQSRSKGIDKIKLISGAVAGQQTQLRINKQVLRT